MAAALALCAGIGQANAAPVLIDNFSTTQTLSATGANATNGSGVLTGADSIGGARFASIKNDANAGGTSNLNINDANNPNAFVAYSNDVNTQSVLHMLWDGGTDATNNFGLGGIDLTSGGFSDRIRIASKSDAGATGTITIFTDATHSSSATFSIPSGLGGTSDPFASVDLTFLSDFAGSADFTTVAAITLDINGPAALDAAIDFISAEPPPQVPEPMTLSLLGFGIIGLGAARRRRRTAQ
jgi:hypothetical protein